MESMKAAVLNSGRITIENVPAPRPLAGQIVVKPLACGICGSDLHARDHAPHLCSLLHRAGFRGFMDPQQPVVMGHEYCCEVLESSGTLQAGTRVVAPPFLTGPDGIVLLGYSNTFPGGFAERMVLDADSCIAVSDDIATEYAAMTEPLAVAIHAVAQADPGPDCGFAVVGCGPVGLFVIARLKALGVGPVLAIEPNPARQQMAERMGADRVISPGGCDAGEWWTAIDLPLGLSDAMEVDPIRRRRSRAVLFECVGKPGMLMELARNAPVAATIVVVGNCMEDDLLEPAFLLQKSLTLKFVFAYTGNEFTTAFEMIRAAPERMAPMVTGIVGLDGVDAAFDALSSGSGVKVLVRP
ncbi:MAG: zinc-binding dehydrogenase [Pseudomonadota bacterium]